MEHAVIASGVLFSSESAVCRGWIASRTERLNRFRSEGLLDLFVESLSVTPADNSWNTILPLLTRVALLISFGLHSNAATDT